MGKKESFVVIEQAAREFARMRGDIRTSRGVDAFITVLVNESKFTGAGSAIDLLGFACWQACVEVNRAKEDTCAEKQTGV